MDGISRRALLGGVLAMTPSAAWAQDGGIDAAVRASGVVGAAGVIVTRDGPPAIFLAGRTRSQGGRALFANDHWHLGSNTKAMTALLWARLAEQGRCRFDAPVAELFSNVPVAPGWAGVTARDLVDHRSGLTDIAMGPEWLLARHGDDRDVRAQRAELAREVLGIAPAGKPGTFAYGNANYLLLGAAMERIVGGTWEAAVSDELFKPLAMKSAAFGAPSSLGPAGHAAGADGPVPSEIDNPAVLGPAGRIHLALDDYARFLRVFLTGGGGYATVETMARLTTPRPGAAYAGGWGVGGDAADPSLAHEGSNTLWHAITVLRPARGYGFAAVVNEGGARGRAGALAVLERLRALHGRT